MVRGPASFHEHNAAIGILCFCEMWRGDLQSLHNSGWLKCGQEMDWPQRGKILVNPIDHQYSHPKLELPVLVFLTTLDK